MLVEVWADVICPWCYLGRARLLAALEGFDHRDEVQVVHRSFELNPQHLPGAGEPMLEMLAVKAGMGEQGAAQAEVQMAGLMAEAGLAYSSGRLTGNTRDAHRLLHLAAGSGRASELLGSLYDAYFGRAESVFDAEHLVPLAVAAGLDEARVAEVLAGDEFTDAVLAEESAAHDLGAHAVPFVVMGRRLGVSGAQSTEVFADALAQAWDLAAG